MKRIDHLLALVTTLLRIPEEKFEQACATVNGIYVIDHVRKPGAISLGAHDGSNEEPLSSWLRRLRREGILQATLFGETSHQSDLPAHINAAFAGTSGLLLQITTITDTHTYSLQTSFSPAYEILPEQFIVLLDAQHDAKTVRNAVATQILESNQLNDRTLFEPDEVSTYLLTAEGRAIFAQSADELFREVQIECAVHGHDFIVPSSLQSLFVRSDSPFGGGFSAMTDELADSIGLSAEERKRAAARAELDSSRWKLQETREPWDYYVFVRVNHDWNTTTIDHEQARLRFISALHDIRQFATTINSPFAEAFRLSEAILTTPLPTGNYDDEHIALTADHLKNSGLSEHAIATFGDTAWMARLFITLDWDDMRIRDLMAVRFADVFGGMGSWNDQYIENDYEKYDAISATMFDAMQNFFASLLSFKRP